MGVLFFLLLFNSGTFDLLKFNRISVKLCVCVCVCDKPIFTILCIVVYLDILSRMGSTLANYIFLQNYLFQINFHIYLQKNCTK